MFKLISIFVFSFFILANPALAKGPVPSFENKHELPEMDLDGDQISERLETKCRELIAQGKGQDLVRFIVMLNGAPDKADQDMVVELGGRVDRVFHLAIQGMSGGLPADKLQALAEAWGSKLYLLDTNPELELAMDTTMAQSRARPLVWRAQTDGYGITGNPNITIGILDTGVDFSHPDLAGKMVVWREFHEEGQYTPSDYNSHGTFVAGIACGNGSVGGNEERTTLEYTIWNDRSPTSGAQMLPMNVPVAGDVVIDMQWTPSNGQACMSLYSQAETEGDLYCGTGGLFQHVWPFDQPGYFILNTPFDGLDWTAEWVHLVTSPWVHPGDEFNLFTGIAADCMLAGLKVMNTHGNGIGFTDAALDAMEFLIAENSVYNIKVANISAGVGGSIPLRTAATNVMNVGTVLVGVTHNNFPGVVGDPGRAEEIITVGAVSDLNVLTNYTAWGHTAYPTKPDVLAPGGSVPPDGDGGGVMGVDSNWSDGFSYFHLPDRVAHNYCNNFSGTSWAAPHVTGLAALIIDALESTGYTWNYTQEDAMLVKNIILMTATETNMPREECGYTNYNPTLDRGGKDNHEGYGMINADAAIEAVIFSRSGDTTYAESITFGADPNDRRCWASKISNPGDSSIRVYLDVPESLDADLYLYAPGWEDGNPILLASSTNVELGADESFSFEPTLTQDCYLTVKRISGEGEATFRILASPVDDSIYSRTHLVDNYPNPFNPRTKIRFAVGAEERVKVSIYDLAGRQVAELVDEVFSAGQQEVNWDGKDQQGKAVASGTFFARLECKSGVESKKIVLVR